VLNDQDNHGARSLRVIFHVVEPHEAQYLMGLPQDIRLVGPVARGAEVYLKQVRFGMQAKRCRHVLKNREIAKERVQLKRPSYADCGDIVRLSAGYLLSRI
jgi:hypothetical protein